MLRQKRIEVKIRKQHRSFMAELVYAQNLKFCAFGHVGSSPTGATNLKEGYHEETDV